MGNEKDEKPQENSESETSELLEMASNEDIDKAWANANFGPLISRRYALKIMVLKCASGYRLGSTAIRIIEELGLVTKNYKLTAKGRRYLWFAFNDNSDF